VRRGAVPCASRALSDWSARELAEENGSTIHTFKELYRFMAERDPRPFIDKNVGYVVDRLSQHSVVASLEMICEASMRLERRKGLIDVVVAVEYEYEFSEEAVVQALKRHPDAHVIVNANPNGRSTGSASAHAEQAGFRSSALANSWEPLTTTESSSAITSRVSIGVKPRAKRSSPHGCIYSVHVALLWAC
jgi:hypothetical protein